MVKAATASELRTKKTKELIAQVGELRTELLALRVAQVSNGAASKLAKISVVRKSIARVLTVINAKARTEMRNQVKGKRTVQIPKQLREKKTRAIRRRLTTEQSEKKTAKAATKASNFPPRKYALKA